MASKRWLYFCRTIIGGGTRALNGIDGAELLHGNAGIIAKDNGEIIFYTLNSTIGGNERFPYLIKPVFNPGLKRWVLCSPVANDSTVLDDLIVQGNLFVAGSVEYGSAYAKKDLLIQDDATIKNFIHVDDEIHGTTERGMTTDFTSGKYRIQVVKGLITKVSQHAGV